MPGEPGNVGLAGHRVGKGSPFLDLDQLRPGDPIVVETVDSWFVYRVLGDVATGDLTADPSGIPGQEIVRPTDVDVLSPTPDGPDDAAPTGSYLTLTTCHPKYSARQRAGDPRGLDGGAIAKATAPDGPPAPERGDLMYSWIWRHLPGNTASRTAIAVVLVLAVCALLLFVVFPWVEPHLPFADVTVDG